MTYLVAIGLMTILCVHLSCKLLLMKPEIIENKVGLEINGKLVLTMTNNCVFIEQTK